MLLKSREHIETSIMDGYRIIIDIDGDLNYYARTLLNIYNHCKAYPSAFIKMWNFDDNRIAVITDDEYVNSVIEWLEGFRHKSEIKMDNVKIIRSDIIDDGNSKLYATIDDLYKATDYAVELIPVINIEV